METHIGKSVPGVRDFQKPGSWAPLTGLRPIYEDGQTVVQDHSYLRQSDDCLSRFSQQNQAQTLMSYSINSAEIRSNPNNYPSIEWQRRGLQDYLPSYGSVNPAQNSFKSLSSWEFPGLEYNSSDPLAQFNDISFGDILGMKGSKLVPSMVPTRMMRDSVGVGTTALSPGWDCSPEGRGLNGGFKLGNPDDSRGLNQQINSNYGQEMQSCAFPHQYKSIGNGNSPPSTNHINGMYSTFAPATPDLRQRPEGNVALVDTYIATDQRPNEQNGPITEVPVPITDPSPGKVSMAVEENPNGIDLNNTPQKKPRRKRYQPKVLSEKRPKRKPKTPKTTDLNGTPIVKRKYVRKNKTKTPPTSSPGGVTEEFHPKSTESTVKSCRKSLNFDLNGGSYVEPQATSQSGHLRQGEKSVVEKSQAGIAYDLNCPTTEEQRNNNSPPEKDNLNSLGNNASRKDAKLAQSPNFSPCASSNEKEQTKGSKRGNSYIIDITGVDPGNMDAIRSAFWQTNHAFPGNANIHRLSGIPNQEIHKKRRTEEGQRSNTSSTSSSATGGIEDASKAGGAQSHPRLDPNASKYYYCNPGPFRTNAVTNNQAEILKARVKNRAQLLNSWASIGRLMNERQSKGTTQVHNLDPLKGTTSISPEPAAQFPCLKKIDISEKPYPFTPSYINRSNGNRSCQEAPAVDADVTPRSKRRSKKHNYVENSRNNVIKHLGLGLYDGNQAIRNPKGFDPVAQRVNYILLERITKRLKQLDINKGDNKVSFQEQNALIPSQVNNQEQNALVLYEKHGAIVPFEGPFDPVRKRRQRPKVDLDDETTRVWNLLLENIDSKGIDGSDEEKSKWWENERSVFRGRVDSFIARMRLVQGDRRFTPWKGSVLDSVIGVFLTQNVSDHLSSSAFMSLAAHFSLKSESSQTTLSEATSTLVVEPEVCIIEPGESTTWNEMTLTQPICDWNSRMFHVIHHSEENEVVNSKQLSGSFPGSNSPKDYSSESSQKAPNESTLNKANSEIIGDDRSREDVTSSQQSGISSQNSVHSQKLGIMSTFSDSNSRTQDPITSSRCNYFDSMTSFMGLLEMAESSLLPDSYDQILGNDRPECMKHATKGYPEAQGISSSDYQLHLKTDFQLQETQYIEMLEVECRSSDTSRKQETSTAEQSNLTAESTMQHLVQEKSSDSIPKSFSDSGYVLEGEKIVKQSQRRSVKQSIGQTSSIWRSTNSPNLSGKTTDVTESTTELGTANYSHKEAEQVSEQDYASGGIFDMANTNPKKPRSGRAGKDKENAYDWDNLRKQVQVNGRNKERTANTRDSLDWEAVRHADVSEIADTIKGRGMNNILARRIKDILNKLVKEHGSLDLEWLRDIPPDKAKEYLLSYRGLGLKSVECVRLLTLHHLAFPVDTNVGRIAVRLGWVPLQPLPESLQLHLLKMYPILESIQKYLWPRLCKLDQKTLYELHYHLITFGKVFCTKRQPNCNACPLRGECRHFASAFTSARLALPGPEERSILASSGVSSTHLNYQPLQPRINPLPLPLSWGNHHPETNSKYNESVPIIELSSSPLSLPLPHTIHPLKRKFEISNCEPIVEIPASPEPESEQTLCDIEDTFYEDPDEIPTIKLNMNQFTKTIENFMQANRELQEDGVSRALVALTPETASIPTPKLKNISRLRTEHHVYELPDTHPLLNGLDKREPDDPCSYLLAIWTPGETANSIQPPERRCSFEDPSILCDQEICSYCSSQREANSQTVRGTLLIPCRTAMRGSFPLNGTYFQVNEVFADHDSSLNPMDVPRSWLWNLPRRTVYFGTSVPTIFRGLSTEDIQHCFWRGYVCVRGFDQKTRAPRPLMARLHFPASKMTRGAKGKAKDE